VNVRRAVVVALNTACMWIDEVAYRPAVIKATERLPRWWQCELARLSMRLDERWDTGYWKDGPALMGACDVCARRAAWLVVGGYDPDYDDEPPEADDFLGQHPVYTCGWCSLTDTAAIRDEASLRRALEDARSKSVAWRWSHRP
jgi:hypothetical protein